MSVPAEPGSPDWNPSAELESGPELPTPPKPRVNRFVAQAEDIEFVSIVNTGAPTDPPLPGNRPWLLVRNPDYFRGVLGSVVDFAPNALHDPKVVVRFGLQGEGQQPNYQIEAPDGRVSPRWGSNHEENANAPGSRYADHNLSDQRFTLVDVRKLLERCLGIQSGTIDPAPDGEGP